MSCEPSVEGNKVVFFDKVRAPNNESIMWGSISLRGNRKIFRDKSGFIYKIEEFEPIVFFNTVHHYDDDTFISRLFSKVRGAFA